MSASQSSRRSFLKTGQASPPADRWLPVFWALDHFKVAQSRDVKEGDWTMPALTGSDLPPAHRAPVARMLVFLKGDDAHDYKYSSAIIEDYGHVSAPWRNRFLAANLSLLRSSSASSDSPLTGRIRRIFAG